MQRLVFSEIHLGTYSREGTAGGAARHLPELSEAGYTAVEVMPVAAFPGARNWGYDGVDLFAAHPAYGGPAGLARLVDTAHGLGRRGELRRPRLGPGAAFRDRERLALGGKRGRRIRRAAAGRRARHRGRFAGSYPARAERRRAARGARDR